MHSNVAKVILIKYAFSRKLLNIFLPKFQIQLNEIACKIPYKQGERSRGFPKNPHRKEKKRKKKYKQKIRSVLPYLTR